jgi:hypothetical protein
MSIATDSNPATPAPVTGPGGAASSPAPAGADGQPGSASGAVERALAAAIRDAGRIGDLLDVLRTARLWLPLPADGTPALTGNAVTLPNCCRS